MDEVPCFQGALFALDHEHAVSGDDEEVLLAGLAVIQPSLARRQHLDPEAELCPVLTAFEVGVLSALLALDPRNLARVENEPPVTPGDEAGLGLLQLCLSNGPVR